MRRRSRGSGGISRRKLLLGAGAGLTGAGLIPSKAFSQFTAGRGTSVELGDGLVGIDAADTVSKSSVSELVTVSNNLKETLTVTVTLASEDQDSSDLYLNGTNVGDSVIFDLSAGNDQIVEVKTSLSQGEYVNWNLKASASGTSISTDGRAEVTTGNKEDAVKINEFKNLSADANKDEFTVGKAVGKDADGDDDLDFAEFTAFDPDNNQIGQTTDSSQIEKDGAEYKLVGGKESITFDASEDLTKGTTYTLRFVLEDVDGNTESVTKDVTA